MQRTPAAPGERHVRDVDEAALRAWPLPIPDGGDKEERGRVLLLGGSREIPGAVVLAATAALRAGAGKVTIATARTIAQAVAFAIPEARVVAFEETEAGGMRADASKLAELEGKVAAVLVGPGLPYDEATRELALGVLQQFADVPVILDAAAMTLAKRSSGPAVKFSGRVLLTPHAGEMASLTGAPKEAIASNACDAARDASERLNALVALKGEITYIASPDGGVWRHHGGNVGLATSGSGDVLSGLIAGLAARGAALDHAAVWGVALHARAGVKLAQRVGVLGYLARELAAEVPALMAAFANAAG